MNFQARLDSGQFVLTVEVLPPHGTDISDTIEQALAIKDLVEAFNVTDNQRAILHASPLSVASLLIKNGLEPIWQLTCRDRNALALQADVLSAAILGVKNVLAVTGDYPAPASVYFNQPVYNLDSVQLLALIKKLIAGTDLQDKPLNGSPRLFLGAAANPGAEPKTIHFIKLLKKIAAGARFIQTQAVFILEDLEKFIIEFGDFARQNWPAVWSDQPAPPLPQVKFLAGIFPLKSARQAVFLNQNLPGVTIPEPMIKKMSATAQPEEEGQKISAWQIGQIRQLHEKYPQLAGAHLMTMGDLGKAKNILEQAQQ